MKLILTSLNVRRYWGQIGNLNWDMDFNDVKFCLLDFAGNKSRKWYRHVIFPFIISSKVHIFRPMRRMSMFILNEHNCTRPSSALFISGVYLGGEDLNFHASSPRFEPGQPLPLPLRIDNIWHIRKRKKLVWPLLFWWDFYIFSRL